MGKSSHLAELHRGGGDGGIRLEGLYRQNNKGIDIVRDLAFSRRSIPQHIIAASVTVTMAMALLVGGSIVRRVPLEILDGTLNVTTLRPGQSFQVHRTIEWKREDCRDVLLDAELVDAFGINHPYGLKPATISYSPDLLSAIGRERTLPYSFPLGPGSFQARLYISCWPFYGWPITVEAPPLRFTVVP